MPRAESRSNGSLIERARTSSALCLTASRGREDKYHEAGGRQRHRAQVVAAIEFLPFFGGVEIDYCAEDAEIGGRPNLQIALLLGWQRRRKDRSDGRKGIRKNLVKLTTQGAAGEGVLIPGVQIGEDALNRAKRTHSAKQTFSIQTVDDQQRRVAVDHAVDRLQFQHARNLAVVDPVEIQGCQAVEVAVRRRPRRRRRSARNRPNGDGIEIRLVPGGQLDLLVSRQEVEVDWQTVAVGGNHHNITFYPSNELGNSKGHSVTPHKADNGILHRTRRPCEVIYFNEKKMDKTPDAFVIVGQFDDRIFIGGRDAR